jgi:hypothetical protein
MTNSVRHGKTTIGPDGAVQIGDDARRARGQGRSRKVRRSIRPQAHRPGISSAAEGQSPGSSLWPRLPDADDVAGGVADSSYPEVGAPAVSFGEGNACQLPADRGVSLERLAALSDGIFAVAMTLLVLGLSVRASSALHPARPLWAPGALASERVVWDVLRRLAPHLLTYLMSFLTLGSSGLASRPSSTSSAAATAT